MTTNLLILSFKLLILKVLMAKFMTLPSFPNRMWIQNRLKPAFGSKLKFYRNKSISMILGY